MAQGEGLRFTKADRGWFNSFFPTIHQECWWIPGSYSKTAFCSVLSAATLGFPQRLTPSSTKSALSLLPPAPITGPKLSWPASSLANLQHDNHFFQRALYHCYWPLHYNIHLSTSFIRKINTNFYSSQKICQMLNKYLKLDLFLVSKKKQITALQCIRCPPVREEVRNRVLWFLTNILPQHHPALLWKLTSHVGNYASHSLYLPRAHGKILKQNPPHPKATHTC